MFFLAKGDCVVMIKDKVHDGHEELKHRTLLPGDHFGVRYIFCYKANFIGNFNDLWMC